MHWKAKKEDRMNADRFSYVNDSVIKKISPYWIDILWILNIEIIAC
jgi:hypothetical protein